MLNIINRSIGELSPKGQDIEIAGGDYLVETAGYIPKEIQLQMLLQSGEALDRYYKRLFPGYVPVEDDTEPVFDPTVQKGYDYFDWHEDVVFVRNQLTEQERRMKIEATAELTKAPEKTTTPPLSVGGEGGGHVQT